MEDLEEAIDLLRRARAAASSDSPTRAAILNNLAVALRNRHESTGRMEDLQDAIALYRYNIDAAAPGSPELPYHLFNLGYSLGTRYVHGRQMDDLQESIAVTRRALDAMPAGSPERPNWLKELGRWLELHYEATDRIEDLMDANAVHREAARLEREMDSAARADAATTIPMEVACAQCGPGTVNVQIIVDLDAIERRPDVVDAIRDHTIHQVACPACGSVLGFVDMPLLLHCPGLGIGLLRRYQRLGNVEDLKEAIAVFRQDLDATPGDGKEMAGRLSSLGAALQTWYEWTERMEDLQEAIGLLRRAADADPRDALALSALGAALRKRAERTGRTEDLHERIALYRRAVAASASGPLQDPAHLANLGIAISDRYSDDPLTEDLNDAASYLSRALEAMPQDSPDRPHVLATLGSVMNTHHATTGKTDFLELATAAGRQAVSSAPVGNPKRPRYLRTLGDSLAHQYRHTARMADLEEAIAVYREALDAGSPDRLHYPDSLRHLASTLHLRYERTGRMEDLQESITVCRQALELSRTRDPGVAVSCACELGRWALERSAWEEAAGAYDEAMTIVDTLYDAQVLRSDKHHRLRSVQGLYAEAAYSKARLGDLPGAVLALETGRARVLTEMLDRARADLEEIERRAPELVHRYRQTLARLRHLEGTAAGGAVARTPAMPEHERRFPEQIREARAELRAAVEAIRASPGGGSFLARPSVEALAAALEPGVPVIYLAATRAGGVALVVSSAAGALDVTPLWLDSLTTAAVVEMVRGSSAELTPGSWFGDYLQWQERPSDRRARAEWHERIERTTRALGDMVMSPVLGLLRERFPEGERAVLIPNGLLALLPLHAAWTDEEGGRRRWALDEVAFHHVPSLRALAHARDLAGTCGQTKLLVVNEPEPVSAPPLPNSRYEIQAAAAQFARDDVTVLAGESCRRDDVLAALADARICHFSHFSCHGKNDWRNPLRSGLLMANDEMLTVEDLFALPGQKARLAVLSACETGIVGADAPNEIVALPAAFVQAGFAGVVASLWSVYDISASLLMARFYELWRREQLAPAVALQRAQIWLRELTSRELVAQLEQLVPELAARLSLETPEALHFRALLQDPATRPFAAPVHWAAFYLTGT